MGKEDNTGCIAAVKQVVYSPALGYLPRHVQVNLKCCQEVFRPVWEDQVVPKYLSELTYWESASHKGDWMTKELSSKDFQKTVLLAGFVPLPSSDVRRSS